MRDVLVIGGGPAGLCAGGLLAERGRETLILEEHEQIGNPVHCTGLLGVEAYQQYDLPSGAILTQHSSTQFHSPSGRVFSYASPKVETYVVDRVQFDRGLAERALAKGAVVQTESRVERIKLLDDGVELDVCQRGEPRKFCARACILASGAGYRLHRSLGLPIPNEYLQTAQIEVDFAPTRHVELHFGREWAPGAFAWVVPFSRNGTTRARLGLITTGPADSYLDRFLRSSRIAGRLGDGVPLLFHRRPIPVSPISKSFCDRVLVVGDAAGLVKPTTGGGIYYSLLSAELAAEALDDAFRRGDFSESSLAEYQRRWHARLILELKIGALFRRMASRLSDSQIERLFTIALEDGVPQLIRSKGSFNWHGELILELLKRPQVCKILLGALAGPAS